MAWGDNERKVREYDDGTYYTFSEGNKDNWHLMYHNSEKDYDLFDKDYLTRIRKVSDAYGKDTVYNAFCSVYDLVTGTALLNNGKPEPSDHDFNEIIKISNLFGSNRKMIIKLLDCFYLTMISEWYYKGSILKHRIKKLGVYQAIYTDMEPVKIANYSKGKSYKILNQEMIQNGIKDFK